jgi:outer membrane immunogenic protein
MKHLARSILLLLVVFTAGSVEAQSVDWTGFYAGLSLGYGWSDQAIKVSGDPLTETIIAAGGIPRSFADDASGVIGGAQAGYNHRIGWLVVGAEADFRGADIGTRERVASAVPNLFAITTTGEQELDFLGTVRGRVGVAPWGGLLLYGTGGFAYGHVRLSAAVDTAGCAGVCASQSRSGVEAGWAAGGGVEYGFATRWSVRAEYLRYDLGSVSVSVRDPAFPALVQRFRTDVEGNVFSLGANYRF